MSISNEKHLVEALKNSDQKAFKEIVNTYQTRVYNTCYGLLQDQYAAQDISQDVFIELFKSVHKFREESKLSTWLYRIAINKSLNHLRDHKKHRLVRSIERFFTQSEEAESLQIEDSSSLNSQQLYEQNDHAMALQKALSKLPINQRTAFVLKNYDDLSYKEIEEVMGLSLSSVESLIHRARLNLQKSLQDYYQENFLR